MSRVFWDTNLFVYLVEGHGRAQQVRALRRRMMEREDEAGDQELRQRYESVITAGATVLPFDARAAPRFAEIRRDRSIRAPDAIQLACASMAGVDLFITNDDRLSRKRVRGIHFIQPLANAML